MDNDVFYTENIEWLGNNHLYDQNTKESSIHFAIFFQIPCF
jgi:hypothetical protein